jgi:ATP-dependent Clp protease ATP-binding subunit ClpB
VLIMTSNIPVALDDDAPSADPHAVIAADARLRAELLDYFKPEFINRLDDIVRFRALTREQISEIVELQVDRVIERVAERGVHVTLTDAARQLLGDLGYDPTYGARPLRRVIQKQLTDRLALALLQGDLREGDDVTVDARDGELVLDKRGAAATPERQTAAA